MSHLIEIMSRRKNIQFFKKEDPSKKLIDSILKQAHELMPHKNNSWYYKIKVYGPEFEEEKKLLAIASVGGEGRLKYKNGTRQDIIELSKIYDEWSSDVPRQKLKVKGCIFNDQVRAPYLLLYTHQKDFLTDSQKNSNYFKSGRYEKTFNKQGKNLKDWIIQSSMHGITTAYLCAEKELYASFCRCYFYNKFIVNDILRKDEETAFMLGIGYKDEKRRYFPSLVPKPLVDEIIEWM